jgi:hypothetical protein
MTRAQAALIRFGRVVAYGAIGTAITAVPQLFTDVPVEYQAFAAVLTTAIIAGLDKARRFVAPRGV